MLVSGARLYGVTTRILPSAQTSPTLVSYCTEQAVEAEAAFNVITLRAK
jgi:hypothetical protein